MRVVDENGNPVQNVDFDLGYYVEDTLFIAHHPAQEYIPEQFHYEIIKEYSNGGRDMIKVIDVPEQQAKEAWDETEQVLRWHPYDEDTIVAKQNAHEIMEAFELLGVTV